MWKMYTVNWVCRNGIHFSIGGNYSIAEARLLAVQLIDGGADDVSITDETGESCPVNGGFVVFG